VVKRALGGAAEAAAELAGEALGNAAGDRVEGLTADGVGPAAEDGLLGGFAWHPLVTRAMAANMAATREFV